MDYYTNVQEVLVAPANVFDFSMFPNNVVPASGAYQAVVGPVIWTIKAGDDRWQVTDRRNP